MCGHTAYDWNTMPMLRRRGGTCTPRSGAATSSPPIAIAPPVGCSRPAMQRKVVVLPQPEGPSSTTISPAATRKLTSSTAGRPTRNCLRRCETISSADIQLLPVPVNLVPLLDPLAVERLELRKFRHPDLGVLGKTRRQQRRDLQRCEIAVLPDAEDLPFFGELPFEIEPRRVRVLRGLGDTGAVGNDRHALGREEGLHRRAVALFRIDDVVDQRRDQNLAAH